MAAAAVPAPAWAQFRVVPVAPPVTAVGGSAGAGSVRPVSLAPALIATGPGKAGLGPVSTLPKAVAPVPAPAPVPSASAIAAPAHPAVAAVLTAAAEEQKASGLEARAAVTGLAASLSQQGAARGGTRQAAHLERFFAGAAGGAGGGMAPAAAEAVRTDRGPDSPAQRELRATLAKTRRLYARFFPAFYLALPMTMSFTAGKSIDGHFALSARGRGEIALQGPVLPVPGVEPARGGTPFEAAPSMDPGLMRLVTSFHEYAHALFYARTGSRRDSTNAFTAFDAVNEGFAVMLELLMIDKAVASREELGLSDGEVADLKAWKRGRFSELRKRTHYTEGTLRFWHRVYKTGGEEAMLRTLDGLAVERLQGVPLDHPVFMLSGGEPRLAEVFTRASGRWEAWIGLANHVAVGAPLAPELRDSAAAELDLVRPEAMSRYFERLLNTRKPDVLLPIHKSPGSLTMLLRLALTSPRAAERLASYLQERLPSVEPLLALTRGPAWMDALMQALTILPLTDAMRADLRRSVGTWAGTRGSSEDERQARRAAAAGLARL